jgi:hypothetical protein
VIHTRIAPDQEIKLSIYPEVEPSCEEYLDFLLDHGEVDVLVTEELTDAALQKRIRELRSEEIEHDIRLLEGAGTSVEMSWSNRALLTVGVALVAISVSGLAYLSFWGLWK